jgi:hypothetical protein
VILKVNITKRNIEEGTPRAARNCPIAKALERYLVIEPNVNSDNFYFYIKNLKHISVKLPKECEEFIALFDSTIKKSNPKPFSFKININKNYVKPKYHIV